MPSLLPGQPLGVAGVVALREMGEHEQPRPAPQCAKSEPGCASCRHRKYCGGGRRVLLLGWRSLAGAAAALRSAAVLDRWVLGEDGVPLAGAYLDALGLYFRCLGDHDLQHAVLRRGFDLVRLNMAGERDRTAEGTVITLGPVHLLIAGALREAPPV